MSARLDLSCNGCDATANVPLLGVLDAQYAAPAGWVVFDPYTLMTYCPACWAGIEGGP